ncbi:ribonucleoside-diphosphate reductase subunit alpha [Amycolatopsis sp. BJA-103]|uniref:ribonucleoside-diphosphate reductase subunit alpha n=1 Tax=unclassified Amycolatopsis TaxID=2618356 RepID=UPI000C75ADF4|nr:ribonucleoside-diphosphate reductase subunit alpha [Amycolatopsis sp. BJA-103]AUI57980.1 ribonucleoside-diphosphate reductase subunit alpha [Amycolatopsis sp. BJA-103]PNE15733.1 ribonucleoside-diphosphate reductase subunit alpha [Amycolatopsis sp. BJA-103]
MSVETGQRPPSSSDTTPATVRVIRRDGSVSPFDANKISVAVTKAFLAVEGGDAAASSRIHHLVNELTEQIEATLLRHAGPETALHIEQIQDIVELALMRGEHHKVARAYVLYRDERAKARESEKPASSDVAISVKAADGTIRPLDWARVSHVVGEAVAGLDDVSAEPVLAEAKRNLYDGISADELALAQIMAARVLVEQEPNYSYVSARLLADKLRGEALSYLAGSPQLASQDEMTARYPQYFRDYLKRAIELELVNPELQTFDLDKITAAIHAERDLDFGFLGLQTLYDRYFQHHNGVRFELPQAFFMRVAMGLAIREDNREARAIEFYELLSSFHFMASTPTLFNSGTTRPQLSSCFLTTVDDDLDSIFQAYKNNALLAKYSGGLGNDWTPVRGLGAHIKGTNGQSQGVVPFLKIANDTAVAVNQGGKRKGAACAYLETWHVDIEEFLDLRKNTGDDRRRTHDMNTANWVPDEFLRRVEADAQWTLFSPNETPDLHDLYGTAFAERYREYEAAAERGELKVFRKVRAIDLWRRMLTMLFETGHPWITFKDPCNLRSPQQHVGVVHSSNLCTEITLNTTTDEVAVCNLGSVNLLKHVTPEGIDAKRLEKTVRTAVRMLDNVIDINFYTIPEARRSNLRHRPIGLGLMGFQDALFEIGVPLSSEEAVQFADTSMEHISYYAISASTDLAEERGQYQTFEGSLWSKGILPIDSLQLLIDARQGDALDVDTSSTLDWAPLRERVKTVGMRNSNVMAIAPTATISNIVGVGQSIEPLFQNLFVKSNMSGDFTVVNPHLVRSLKERGLWDEVMVSDLKYFDGSLGQIDRVPDDLKALYATAFEIESRWLVDAGSRRQKWIDQAQSLNLYIAAPSGRKLDELYRYAWHKGLKTTYYLRARSATHVEKSTLRGTDGKLNAVSATPAPATPSAPKPAAPAASPAPSASAAVSPSPAAAVPAVPVTAPEPKEIPQVSDVDFVATDGAACRIDDPDCEACQ